MKWTRPVFFAHASAETIALSVALGLMFGLFPMYGCPTLLCAAAAIVLRLNFPALQLVNYLASPLQLALLVPFNRVGARLFPSFGADRTPRSVHPDMWRLALDSVVAALHAIVGWFCVCLPLGILLYFALKYVLDCRRPKNVSMDGDLKRLLNAA